MKQKRKCLSVLALIVFASILGGGCAGLQPPVRHASEAQFEKGLTYSEKEFQKPIDILQGEWAPVDSLKASSKVESQPTQGNFFIQIISLSTQNQAQQFIRKIKKIYPRKHFFMRKRGKYWAVWVGRFQNREAAQKALASIWMKRFPDAWIIHEK